jgi:hypothetical protein
MTRVAVLPRTYIFFSVLLAFMIAAFLVVYPAFAQERKDIVKQRVETRKELATLRRADVMEKMASREAALKLKLDTFRDQRKATVAAKINTNLNKINDKQTEMMLKHLTVMTKILNKLEEKVGSTSAITDSETKIASATAAVEAQANKDYTITATSEATIKADAKTMRDSLHTDLKAVRQLVIDAKQSVAKAIMEARSGK